MQLTISPTDFARVMALPNSLRHDVLEFLGSTPVAAGEVERVVRSLTARGAAKEHLAGSEAA